MNTSAFFEGRPLPAPKQTIRAVLEEAADDALDADVFRQPRNARAQAADAAHDQVDLHAGAGGLVELQIIRSSTIEFSLAQIWPLRPVRTWAISSSIRPNQGLADTVRRQRQLLQTGGPGIAGHEVERLGGIAAERRVAGEEGDVRVDLGGDRVVVAGAELAVGAEAARPPGARPARPWRAS